MFPRVARSSIYCYDCYCCIGHRGELNWNTGRLLIYHGMPLMIGVSVNNRWYLIPPLWRKKCTSFRVLPTTNQETNWPFAVADSINNWIASTKIARQVQTLDANLEEMCAAAGGYRHYLTLRRVLLLLLLVNMGWWSCALLALKRTINGHNWAAFCKHLLSVPLWFIRESPRVQ